MLPEPKDDVACLMCLWLTCALVLLASGLSIMPLSRTVGGVLCVPGLAIVGLAVWYWWGQRKA